MFEIIGGRKFLAFVVAIAVLVVSYLVLGKMGEAAFLDGIKWIIGIYVAGNVGDSIAGIFTKPEVK